MPPAPRVASSTGGSLGLASLVCGCFPARRHSPATDGDDGVDGDGDGDSGDDDDRGEDAGGVGSVCEIDTPKPSCNTLPISSSDMQQQQQQQQQQQRTYVNLPMLESAAASRSLPSQRQHHEYMNMAATAGGLQGPQPEELSNPQLNYMEMDFSTGVGLPAAAAAAAPSERLLQYAQLILPGDSRGGRQAQQQEQQELAANSRIVYCELDLRAMAALAATVKEEARLVSGSLPRLRQQQQLQLQQQHQQRQRSFGPLRHQHSVSGRPSVEKSSSFSRIRSSLSRSLSRLSLRRPVKSQTEQD